MDLKTNLILIAMETDASTPSPWTLLMSRTAELPERSHSCQSLLTANSGSLIWMLAGASLTFDHISAQTGKLKCLSTCVQNNYPAYAGKEEILGKPAHTLS